MSGPDPLRDRLALVICAAWWRVCETPQTWAGSGPQKRATFLDMADCALAAARAGARSEAGIAKALCDGFWRGEDPRVARPFELLRGQAREVFMVVARDVLAAGRAWRAEGRARASSEITEVREEAHA